MISSSQTYLDSQTANNMVSLSEVIASNGRVAKSLPSGLVAVFVGGTSGVGEYTVKAFARYATKPRVYIIGRSQDAATRIIRECQKANPDGTFEFIKADVSLIKTVDDVCGQIKSKETAINILFESQGSMAFSKGMWLRGLVTWQMCLPTYDTQLRDDRIPSSI